jgi:hypothetical protein
MKLRYSRDSYTIYKEDPSESPIGYDTIREAGRVQTWLKYQLVPEAGHWDASLLAPSLGQGQASIFVNVRDCFHTTSW